ncbi:hypothetical protein D1007_42095 [Hordeum vulgare]|nr:hypothetical protein D1007_42095 [Hordeum vulgare]
MKKEIAAAHVAEVALVAIHADLEILEEHLANEATIDTSCADAATQLAALNNSSWRFHKSTVGAFDKDYKVFSQRAPAYLNCTARS